MEEAPESYKDVTDVVNTCHAAGISQKCIKLRPIGVIKGWKKEFNDDYWKPVIFSLKKTFFLFPTLMNIQHTLYNFGFIHTRRETINLIYSIKS